MTGCYYRRLGTDGDYQLFAATDATRSNWDPEIQHGSPPLALLTRAIEERLAGSPMRIARLTLDILGVIPVSAVRVRAWVQRPGRRISLVAAEMTPSDGGESRAVARVVGWALATSDTPMPPPTAILRWSRDQLGHCRKTGGTSADIWRAWTGGRSPTTPPARCSGSRSERS